MFLKALVLFGTHQYSTRHLTDPPTPLTFRGLALSQGVQDYSANRSKTNRPMGRGQPRKARRVRSASEVLRVGKGVLMWGVLLDGACGRVLTPAGGWRLGVFVWGV